MTLARPFSSTPEDNFLNRQGETKMAQDWIPSADAELNEWLQNFLNYANSDPAALGLVAADLTPLQTVVNTWHSAYTDHVQAQTAAQSAREHKDTIRDNIEAILRPLVNRIQATPSVTDAQRQALGITVRSSARTPVGAPTTRPVATV